MELNFCKYCMQMTNHKIKIGGKRCLKCKNETHEHTPNIKYFAWCPICFDALLSISNEDKSGLIKSYKYYCDGCDKGFEFK